MSAAPIPSAHRRLRWGCGLRFETNTENPENSLALPARRNASWVESWCTEINKLASFEACALASNDRFGPSASMSITRCPASVNICTKYLVTLLLKEYSANPDADMAPGSVAEWPVSIAIVAATLFFALDDCYDDKNRDQEAKMPPQCTV